MVVVKLQGGMGNQMFEYAAARAFANDSTVYIDNTFLLSNTKNRLGFTARNYELGIFSSLNAKIASDKLLAFARLGRTKRILRALRVYNEISDRDLSNAVTSVFILALDGYFQSALIFENQRAQLIEEFKFPELSHPTEKLWQTKIAQAANAVSIHVRRGDYLQPITKDYHNVLPLSYYQDAIGLMKDRLNNAEYFVFSDDLDWCKDNLIINDSPVHYVTGTRAAWTDMALMSQCKHHIIANSSFSWWGAWLSESQEKTVIAPKKWYVHNNVSPVPGQWITL